MATTNPFSDMPDEFNVEMPAGSENYVAGSSPTTSSSFDDLDDVTFDDSRDEIERAKLYPPPGDWVKSDRWQFRQARYEGDCQPGDINPVGRTMYIFFGKPEVRLDKDRNPHEPILSIRMSPDRRYKQDDPNKVDFAYQMYLKAKDVFLTIKGTKCRKPPELVPFMCDESYLVRTMTGDNGPFVLEVKASREQRKTAN